MAVAQRKPAVSKRPRILVVDDEPVLVELFRDAIIHSVPCQVVAASNLREAHRILSRQDINLLVTDVMLPDGSGLSLLPDLHRLQPSAAALVVTGISNMETAVDAIRNGAIDFVPKPFSADQITQRVAKALADQDARQRQEARLLKLRTAFKRLHAARRVISKKVDLLCNDLIGAYGELSRQVDMVRLQSGYRQVIDHAAGLEQLLCHTMDWLLRQLGYCNIGLWLASSEQELQLGAYMKYTAVAEPDLIDAMQKNLLRIVMRRGFLRLREPEVKSHLVATELKYLSGQDILGINCTYLGETLGVMVLFRDHKTPFSDDDVNALKTISPLFALALAKAVKNMETPNDDGNCPDDPPHHKKGKKDPADWWKSGGQPPF